MKKLMMLGGLIGFGIGVATGVVKEVTWPALFLRACIAALISGWLFRWWGRVWLSGLRDSLAQAATAAQNGKNGSATK